MLEILAHAGRVGGDMCLTTPPYQVSHAGVDQCIRAVGDEEAGLAGRLQLVEVLEQRVAVVEEAAGVFGHVLVEERVSDVDRVLHVDKDALRRDLDVLVLEPLHELSQEADHGLGKDVDELDHLGELGLERTCKICTCVHKF